MDRIARPKLPALLAACCLVLAATVVSCRPEVVVQMTTRVFHDGSLERELDVRGRPADPDKAIGRDWLTETVGLQVASPERWGRIDRGDDRLRATGFFTDSGALPPWLTFTTRHGTREDRSRTDLRVEERTVLRRWVYVELHGDPYGSVDVDGALRELAEIVVEALRRETERELGSAVDTSRAERLWREEGVALVGALLRSRARSSAADDRRALWSAVLTQHGAPVASEVEEEGYWESQLPGLLDWSRERTAEALSTADRRVTPEELGFWPVGDDYESGFTELVARNWGGEEELLERIEPHIAALSGYFGSGEAPRLRFEVRVELPGTLLFTNGSPSDDGAIWLMRESDLTFGDRYLRAESVAPVAEALTRMGARRELAHAELLRLRDLLWTRDPDGVLNGALQIALRRGTLDPLRDESEIPEEHLELALELADLLDPSS